MSGQSGYVVPLPLYYRFGQESLAQVAARPLDVFIKADPDLQTASIQGANALRTSGMYLGMFAVAMGWQVTEVAQMIANPLAFEDRFYEALTQHPELSPAIDYLTQLADSDSYRRSATVSLLNKIQPILLDDTSKAIYGAHTPGIDWERVVAEGWIVIFDFSNVTGLQMRLIGMQFVLAYILEFIKQRGPGRHKPISLIIDELLALFPQVGEGERQMEADIDALVNIYSRNYRLFTCVSLQSVSQVGERLQRTLLSMPTQIHGVATDADSAAILARSFSSYQPQSLKDVRPVWGTDVLGPFIQDYTPTFYSIEEQLELDAQVFRDLRPFGFLARMPTQEGSIHGPINKISIARIDAGLYPDDQLMATSLPLFTRIPGLPIDEVNQESVANGPYGASPQISFPGDGGQVLGPDDRVPFFTD